MNAVSDNKVRQLKPAQKGGLGRGLSTLLGDNAPGGQRIRQEFSDAPQQKIALQLIEPGKFQPRKHFSETELTELTESIRKSGVVQPIIVRKSSVNTFELIAGERRWRAAKQAGLTEIPAVIMELSDRQAMEVALVENIQRQNLKPLEVALGYSRLLEEFNYTQEQLAEVIGKSRAQVSNYLRLIDLPADVKQSIDDEKITVGHAKILLALDNVETVSELAKTIIKRGLNVRQTEAIVKKLTKTVDIRSKPRGSAYRDPDIVELEKALSLKLGLEIHIDNKDNHGRITINYSSLEQLDSILRRLES